jgi:hypothetical protein
MIEPSRNSSPHTANSVKTVQNLEKQGNPTFWWPGVDFPQKAWKSRRFPEYDVENLEAEACVSGQ